MGKVVTITPAKDGGGLWGAEVSIGSTATTTDFPDVTVSKYAYDEDANLIKSLGSETVSSFSHYVPDEPEEIDDYAFDTWFSDDGLTSPYANGLLLSATSIYAKYDSYESLANDYGQYFIDHVGCHADGVEDPDGWNDVAAAYPTISGVRSIICSTDPVIDGSVLERCVYWYKDAITQHPSLTKFMVDEDGDPRAFAAKNPTVMQRKTDENLVVISTVGIVAILSVGGLCFITKKRREQE